MLTHTERIILTGIEYIGGTCVVIAVLIVLWMWRVSTHRGGWEG